MARSVYGFAGRGAFDRNTRAMRAAERASHAPGWQAPPTPVVPAATPTQCYVQVTAARHEGDRRNPYPAALYWRDAEAESAGDDWRAVGEDDEAAPVPCVAITPNGECLRKDVRYEARVLGTFEVPESPAPTFAAVLAIRTSGVAGTLSIGIDDLEPYGGSPPFQVGDQVTISWDDKHQVTYITETDEGVNADFAGGGAGAGESELPAEGAAVTVTWRRLVALPVVQVDCTDAVEIIRTTSKRNEDGDYQGFIQEWDATAGGWRDGEEVWVRNAN